jgi:hypothetical protein
MRRIMIDHNRILPRKNPPPRRINSHPTWQPDWAIKKSRVIEMCPTIHLAEAAVPATGHAYCSQVVQQRQEAKHLIPRGRNIKCRTRNFERRTVSFLRTRTFLVRYSTFCRWTTLTRPSLPTTAADFPPPSAYSDAHLPARHGKSPPRGASAARPPPDGSCPGATAPGC